MQTRYRFITALVTLLMIGTNVPFTAESQILEDDEPVLDSCPEGTPWSSVRNYTVTALPVPIIYNNWGDFDPYGLMYVATDRRAELLDQVAAELSKPEAEGKKVLGRVVQNLTYAKENLTKPYPTQTEITNAISVLAKMGSAFLQDQAAATASVVHPLPRPVELQQPLTIRAKLGECVQVFLTNLMDQPVSMHIHGVVAKPGQGTSLGLNGPDFTMPGQTSVYIVHVPSQVQGLEGAHMFHSHTDARHQTRHGLFGSLVVEKSGSSWFTQSGLPSASGQDAIIKRNVGWDFREFVLYYHDEIQLYSLNSTEATPRPLMPLPVISPQPFNEYGPGSKGINYRSEPFMNRFMKDREGDLTWDKSQAYGSYTYGDPGVFIPRSYVGDPVKFRLINVGPGQHHVHHLHGGGDRWRASPAADPAGSQFDTGLKKYNSVNKSASERLDVQNIGPGESFNAEIEGGSGGVQQAAGDFLYHCHIVEHYVAGMWSFWRVYNTNQTGLAALPDRIILADAVDSNALWGKNYNGTTLDTLEKVRAHIAAQLPPPGVRASDDDASVYDWVYDETDGLFYGEPDDTKVWANYQSTTPGERHPLKFNETNGRLAYPFLSPHLGKRPPFAPGHGPSPYLGMYANQDSLIQRDGLCPRNDLEYVRDHTRNYSIVAQAATIHYNKKDKLHTGMVFTHAENTWKFADPDYDDATSLVIRANQGDCVNVVFANNLSATDTKSKANMHIHLVQFDVQASDGVISGFAYEQSVKPVRATGTTLAAHAKAGDWSIKVNDPSKIRAGTWIGVGLLNKNVDVRFAESVLSDGTVTFSEPLKFDHHEGQWASVEFVRYQWYPDVELGVVYWHDHVDGVGGWQRGLFASLIVEPKDSRWCDPRRVIDGPATQDALKNCPDVNETHVLDIINHSDPSQSFREIVLQVQDRGCLLDDAGNPCTAGSDSPSWPEPRVGDVATFNLRSSNLRWRNVDLPFWSDADTVLPGETGAQGDPATAETGLLRAYPGDKVRIRLIYTGQSDMTGVGTFSTPGHRFKFESGLAGSSLMDSVSFGISSMHNLELDCGAGGCAKQPGDYMYLMTGANMLDRGAWGIFRVHDGDQTDLRPLPNNIGWSKGDLTMPTGTTPREFDITAARSNVALRPDLLPGLNITRERSYFALTPELADVKGAMNATPLVIRVKEGEWFKVTVRRDTTIGESISFSPGMVLVNPNETYGIPIGKNVDLRVNDTPRTFLYKADKAVGVARATSYGQYTNAFGTPINQADQGLFGAVVVEPADAWFSNDRRASADIILDRDDSKWREHILVYESDDEQFFSSTMKYYVEVRGFPTVNYRTDPLHTRVGGVRDPTEELWIGGMGIHSCQLDPDFCHGDFRLDVRNPLNPAAYALLDPKTPVLDVSVNVGLVVRALGGAGDQLAVHSLDGHFWAQDPDMKGCDDNNSYLITCKSNIISSATLGPGQASNAWIPAEFVGRGGEGDYLWGNHRDPFREAGQWGVLRVCGPEIGGSLANGTFGCTKEKLSSISNEASKAVQDAFREAAEEATENAEALLQRIRDAANDPQTAVCEATSSSPTERALVVIPPAAFRANAAGLNNPGFVPVCITLPSLKTVRFEHADFQVPGSFVVPHNPGSFRDRGDGSANRCFVASAHRPGEQMGVNDDFDVTFRWDPLQGKLYALPGLAAERECTNAIDPAQSSDTRKVIPYQCDRHPNMVGVIVVSLTGSTDGQSAITPPPGPPGFNNEL